MRGWWKCLCGVSKDDVRGRTESTAYSLGPRDGDTAMTGEARFDARTKVFRAVQRLDGAVSQQLSGSR